MQFNEAVQYLLSLGHETLTIKLGLKTTELLLRSLGDPQKTYPAVQIAGTNGKGSTATVLDSICRAAGIKSGLYTSPHLVSITERIKVHGIEILPEAFAAHVTQVRDVAEKLVVSKELEALPTFFEQVTAIALQAFREAKVELAILETGLGGRLDSTTAAKAQLVAITHLAMDHEEYLGNTLESIAAEKAAIIRPGVRAVIAAQAPEALEVIRRQCEIADVKPAINGCRTSVEQISADGLFCVTFETAVDVYEKLWLGLRGRHQIENVAVSIQLAENLRAEGFAIPQRAIVEGVESARHAGRMELIPDKPNFLLDGAHNPAGAQALRDYLDDFAPGPLTLVFGAMRDKRLEEMAEILFPAADHVVLTAINNPRAASTELLQTIARRFMTEERITLASSSAEALTVAHEKTTSDGLICITGSLYLIGETRPLILKKAGLEVA
jgi:dihydrofolate synthase/folylpolyglutamate synthase